MEGIYTYGSGIEDILGCIYKGAAHRAVMNVHNFNYSWRCCKLLYSALSILFIESFVKSTLSATSNFTYIQKLQQFLEVLPSEYASDKEKQYWFSSFMNEIKRMHLLTFINKWANEQSEKNIAFRFWYFIYRHLLEPVILLYMSVRSSNFNGKFYIKV